LKRTSNQEGAMKCEMFDFTPCEGLIYHKMNPLIKDKKEMDLSNFHITSMQLFSEIIDDIKGIKR
jgi:hypothetical protein